MRVNHIGIIVEDIDKAVKPYERVFNIQVEEQIVMEKFKVKLAFLSFENIELEFIQPLSNEGEFYKFLKSHGGLHHMAFEVDSLTDTLAELKSKSIKMKDDKPKVGARNSLVAFSEPEIFDGVTIEFKQLEK